MVILKVDGMTCGGCAKSVEAIIRRVDPQAVVKVDLANGRVEAETNASVEVLSKAVTAGGYDAHQA